MDAARRKLLKQQGKLEIERRSAERKARSAALLPDMMAALSHSGNLPANPERLRGDDRERFEKELWVREKKPTIREEQLNSAFIPLPDTNGKWKGHPLSYFMCKRCKSALPAIPPSRPIYASRCACGNMSWLKIFNFARLFVRDPKKLLSIALFARAKNDG
ncbi:hypothetical protein [Denitromonas iodatirespirans]|uniref:Uncharacterized protein n=1 Tax=Denitromonas iodatirespirans TaxID=2795389 RepID=A0A944DFJ5_DENI1|nr:hypothetical protein [Denitromonas iodatirespirans]MBT0961893.1 hypothetical protein [Denitromonas iodatirespirans]